MEAILANEEEHAEDMKRLLETVGKEEKQRDTDEDENGRSDDLQTISQSRGQRSWRL